MKKRDSKSVKGGNKVVIVVVALIISYFAAFLGSLFTMDAVKSDWYSAIRPALTPPNFVFPVVWNILFFLIGISLAMAWIYSKNREQRRKVSEVFAVNLFLNIIWSYLYFGSRNPFLGFLDIILLWVSIILVMFVCWKINKVSAYLIVPYFLWVSFAAVLNYLSIR